MKARTVVRTNRSGALLEAPGRRDGALGRYVGVVERLSSAYLRSLEQRIAAMRGRR